MKKWSKKRKLVFFALLLLISTLLIGALSNRNSPTLKIAIRRAERQQLIGPSEIIDTLEYDWGKIHLGKTEHGWITYEYTDDLGWDHAELRYFPEGEDVTIFCPDFLLQTDYKKWLPIYVIPKNTKPSSASITLRVSCPESSADYQLTAEKLPQGYYLFSLPGEELEGECFWLLQQTITGSWQEYVITGTVDIQIEFYDRSGNLIDTYRKTVTK